MTKKAHIEPQVAVTEAPAFDPETGEVSLEQVEQRLLPLAYVEQYIQKMKALGLTPDSVAEIPDPIPMAPPVGWVEQPSMIDHIRNLVRGELLRRQADVDGFESFEEADDFDTGEDDDHDIRSGYEYEPEFEPPAPPAPPVPQPQSSEVPLSTSPHPGTSQGVQGAGSPPASSAPTGSGQQ